MLPKFLTCLIALASVSVFAASRGSLSCGNSGCCQSVTTLNATAAQAVCLHPACCAARVCSCSGSVTENFCTCDATAAVTVIENEPQRWLIGDTVDDVHGTVPSAEQSRSVQIANTAASQRKCRWQALVCVWIE